LSEFKAEGLILGFVAVFLLVHLFGARLNRNKAKKWMRAHAAPLASEFATVGFKGVPLPTLEKNGEDLVKQVEDSDLSKSALKESSLFEFTTYATGRANVAFVDVKLTLKKRFNPLIVISEYVLGFFMESLGQPEDVCEAILYPFDGQEEKLVPSVPGAAELRPKDSKSSYDNFVWGLVHKERMKQVRDDRYDVSLTLTKDNSKLPNWLTVMTESAEITDLILTPELIKAAETAGDLFEYLIVTDQPVDRPTTVDETKPRKRIFLKYRLPSDGDYTPLLPIFKIYLRLSDLLAQSAHFRPEVTRKVRLVREEAIKFIKKADEEEKAAELAAEREKARKAKRDAELSQLDAKAQKKYLEKERERELRKQTKRQTTRG